MIALLLAATLAAAPAPVAPADAHKDHAQHQGMAKDEGCKMECCKDKKMPCCADKAAAAKPADAPAAEGHGAHNHDH
jgi:hypothetical protein